jgi:hypothetical protein
MNGADAFLYINIYMAKMWKRRKQSGIALKFSKNRLIILYKNVRDCFFFL